MNLNFFKVAEDEVLNLSDFYFLRMFLIVLYSIVESGSQRNFVNTKT